VFSLDILSHRRFYVNMGDVLERNLLLNFHAFRRKGDGPRPTTR
jgi:hypothetical protein